MKKIVQTALLNSLGVAVYTGLVAALMNSAESIFGKMSDVVGPMAFLLLFVFSALIVGILILGKPLMLYLENNKKSALQILGYEVVFIFVFLILSLLASAIF